MALRTPSPTRHTLYDPFARRYQLYVLAAPVFRTFGYRQVTMKALAHACGMSAPGLYRYFPSKLEFATFPLAPAPHGTCAYLLARAASTSDLPLGRLRALLEGTLLYVDLAALAFDLAIQAGQEERPDFLYEKLGSVETSITDVVLSCMPELGARAADLVHTITALILAAGATRSLPSRDDLWRQALPIVRAHVTAAGVDPARFDGVFAAPR